MELPKKSVDTVELDFTPQEKVVYDAYEKKASRKKGNFTFLGVQKGLPKD